MFSNNYSNIWQRRSNLSQIHIKVLYSQAPPYLEVLQRNNTTIFKGVFGEVFDLLHQKLGFQFTMILEPHSQARKNQTEKSYIRFLFFKSNVIYL
jgi:hypothetical protein